VFYETIWEHLADELKLVELLVSKQVFEQRKCRSARPLDQFMGLVLSDEEIAFLLNDATGSKDSRASDPARDSESQALYDSINQQALNIRKRRGESVQKGMFLPLVSVSQLFQLTQFEESCLIICLAPELDRKYEKLYAYVQDDVTRNRPSIDLALNLLCNSIQEQVAARLSFDSRAPLLKYRLLQTSDGAPESPSTLLSRPLKIDNRIVNFLLGINQIDQRLEPFARLEVPDKAKCPAGTEEIRGRITQLWRSHLNAQEALGRKLVSYLCGPRGSGRLALAKAVSLDMGLPLIVADARRIVAAAQPFDEIICLLGRECVLQPAALCLENLDALLVDDDKHREQLSSLAEMIGSLSLVTFLLGTQQWKPPESLNQHLFVSTQLPVPDERERKALWETQLSLLGQIQIAGEAGGLASKFRFTPGQIAEAVVAAQHQARWRAPDQPQVTVDDLYAACRIQSNLRLSKLAQKIEPKYEWADLVLPDDQLSQIREICHQAQYRYLVYGEWGFDRKLSLGKGLNVLFAGPPGTGKTMTAEVVSNELRLDLYKIDLSQVVSKYIGETEKNLHQIFLEAQTSNAILFFDEADALFGKRSEVKDAHDRYANIEIGYLLQKMEEYEGIAILATNLRQHLDEAFVRRMHVIVEFPFPDEEDRRRIWEVTFPSEAPVGADVSFPRLAREIQLAGGNIKNIALAAAFYAAQDGKVITTEHLARAASREYQKLGRTWNRVELSRLP
jgi:AAA+ superfamily predicted ATPase